MNIQASKNRLYLHQAQYESAIAPKCFGLVLLVLLSGYAVFGKGFAYFGIPPTVLESIGFPSQTSLYAGEIGLIFALLTLFSVISLALWKSPVTWLIIAFMLWGLFRTAPYVGTYGANALRDGVVWGYAIYALAVATTLMRLNAIETVVNLYGRGLRIFLIVAPIVYALHLQADDYIPRWPWGPIDGISVLNPKAGDVAVHYAGGFAFIALGLSTSPLSTGWMFFWMLGATSLAAFNRGAMLAIASAVGLVMFLRPQLKYFYAMVIGVVCMTFFYLAIMLVSPKGLDVGLSDRRNVSIEQIIKNAESVFFASDDARLEGTKLWRAEWWDKIVDYTIYGDYFWTGKGFGINLADDDGFQVERDHELRSPHSAHMTILARTGVPGLLLWIVLQATFALKLFLNFVQDRRANRTKLASTELWILLYWIAFMINGSVDVFLEGPQGGIWFWSIFGFGLALIVNHRYLATKYENTAADHGARKAFSIKNAANLSRSFQE